jgi:hypothetical protein
VEDLEQEQVDSGDRVEDPLTPADAQGSTELGEGEWLQDICRVIADLSQGRHQECIHGPMLQLPGERKLFSPHASCATRRTESEMKLGVPTYLMAFRENPS